MAEIRTHNRELLFWLALRKFQQDPRAAAGSATAQSAWRKVDEFVRQLARWRESLRAMVDPLVTSIRVARPV